MNLFSATPIMLKQANLNDLKVRQLLFKYELAMRFPEAISITDRKFSAPFDPGAL